MTEVRANWFTPLWNTLWRLTVLFLALYFMWRVRSIVALVLLSGALAYTLSFPVDWIMRGWQRLMPRVGTRHGRRVWALVICYTIVGIVVFKGANSFVKPLREQVATLSSNSQIYRAKWDRWYTGNVDLAVRTQIKRFTSSREFSDIGARLWAPVTGILQSSSRLVNDIVELILIPVLAFYFLLDARRLKRDLFQFVPSQYMMLGARICHETNVTMRGYVISQAILCLIAGVFTWAMFAILGAVFNSDVGRYAVMVGIYAGITRAIPVLGPLIGGIPVVALAALSTGGAQAGAIVAVLFTFMHFAESKFVMPMIVGEKLDLHAVWVILSLLIGAEFFGLIGMFFAAPVAAVARNIWRYYYLPRSRPAARRVHVQLVAEKERLAR